MGLDMYAFSLDRSPAFTKPRDILNFIAPPGGKELLQFSVSVIGFAHGKFTIPDHGEDLLNSKYVLPGSTLLHRWRKHPDLHGWMERRWNSMQWHQRARKMFSKEARMPLDVQALDALEHAVRNRRLPKTSGFYFGESIGTEMEDDLAFIAAARQEIAAGKFVYYTSWW